MPRAAYDWLRGDQAGRTLSQPIRRKFRAMNLRLDFRVALALMFALSLLGCGAHRPAQSVEPGAAPEANATTPPQSAAKAGDSGQRSNLDSGDGWEILSQTGGVDFKPYMREMLQVVKGHWYEGMPQEASAGAKGKVAVTVEILRDGTVPGQYPQIETASGVELLDKAALHAVQKSEPFNALPEQFHGPYLKLRIMFVYNMPAN